MKHLTIENLFAYGTSFAMIFGGEFLLRPLIDSTILRIAAAVAVTLLLAPLVAVVFVTVLARFKRPG